MDDPTVCWHRYLVAISALEPDEDEATQALIDLVQWLRVGGRPPDGFTTSEIRALVAGIKTDTAPGWRCGRSSQPWGLPLSAGDDHVDVARAAGAVDKAFAPGGEMNGGCVWPPGLILLLLVHDHHRCPGRVISLAPSHGANAVAAFVAFIATSPRRGTR